MSEVAARNAIIRCIRQIVEPKTWESGYVHDGKHLRLWCPFRPKVFRGHRVINRIEALGTDWFSNDGYGGGLCTIQFKEAPLHELARVLEWLLTNPETRK